MTSPAAVSPRDKTLFQLEADTDALRRIAAHARGCRSQHRHSNRTATSLGRDRGTSSRAHEEQARILTCAGRAGDHVDASLLRHVLEGDLERVICHGALIRTD